MAVMVFERARANAGLAIGFLAQALQYGAGLLMMPFLVTRLSAPEVGIWYVFITAQGLATVADFGFQPTFSRYFSLAHSGVTSIARQGLGGAGSGKPNARLIGDLLHAARRLYLGLALAILVLLIAGGGAYSLVVMNHGGLDSAEVGAAWCAFAAGIALNLYFLWIPAYLLGSGHADRNYIFLILSRGGIALFGIPILFAGGGLLALSLGYLASQLTARGLGALLLRGTIPPREGPPGMRADADVLKTVWPNASKLGLVGIGSFLISRYNIFVVSTFIGLTASASYAISLQLFSGLASIAQLPMQFSLPRIVAARVAGDRPALRRGAITIIGFFIFAFCLGASVVVGLGEFALRSIGSHVALLAIGPLTLMAGIILLEGVHSVSAFVITTANQVPFVVPALVSGAAIAILGTLVAAYGGGILGIIVVQGAVQLAYNNWKWPLEVYRDLKR